MASMSGEKVIGHQRSDSFGEFQEAKPLHVPTSDEVKDLRRIEQKLDDQRQTLIAETIATEPTCPSMSGAITQEPAAMIQEEEKPISSHTSTQSSSLPTLSTSSPSTSSHWSDAIWNKLAALSAFRDSSSSSSKTKKQRRPSVVRRQTMSGPISGAPGFDPDASARWNHGHWSMHADQEHERDRLPIPVELKQRRYDTDPVIEPWHAARIQALFPRRLRLGKTWSLLYSLDQHGASLSTLYSRVGRLSSDMTSMTSGPSEAWLRGSSAAARSAALGTSAPAACTSLSANATTSMMDCAVVLAVRDADDNIFGAFVNEPFHVASHYYGNGQCFLWKTVQRRLPAVPEITDGDASKHDDLHPDRAIEYFRWSGENDYMVLSESDYLSVGGGDGRYGLWLDDTLTNGLSGRCPAFHNEVLCDPHESNASHAADNAPKPPADLLGPVDETQNQVESQANMSETKRFSCIGLEVWAVGIE